MLDLAISLESLLVDNPGEHKWKVGLHSALLLSGDLEEKIRARKIIEEVYNQRSKLVHTGKIDNITKIKKEDKKIPPAEVLKDGCLICSKIIRKIIALGETPNWKEFELNSSILEELENGEKDARSR